MVERNTTAVSNVQELIWQERGTQGQGVHHCNHKVVNSSHVTKNIKRRKGLKTNGRCSLNTRLDKKLVVHLTAVYPSTFDKSVCRIELKLGD